MSNHLAVSTAVPRLDIFVPLLADNQTIGRYMHVPRGMRLPIDSLLSSNILSLATLDTNASNHLCLKKRRIMSRSNTAWCKIVPPSLSSINHTSARDRQNISPHVAHGLQSLIVHANQTTDRLCVHAAMDWPVRNLSATQPPCETTLRNNDVTSMSTKVHDSYITKHFFSTVPHSIQYSSGEPEVSQLMPNDHICIASTSHITNSVETSGSSREAWQDWCKPQRADKKRPRQRLNISKRTDIGVIQRLAYAQH
jgi:hypothetical protein